MAELVLVADGAYPHDDYDFLPGEVKAWAGYVGGHTAHDWTREEVEHLEGTGRSWWAIWTAVQGRALTSDDVAADVAGMLAGLKRLDRPPIMPVIYDIEYSTWAADPHTTTQHAQQWCALMRSHGYPNALWYGPCASVAPWRACWTGQAPDHLLAGVVGVQYDHGLADDRYDISVFDPSLLINGGTADMTPEQLKAINDHVDAAIGNLFQALFDDPHRPTPTLTRLGDVLHANTDTVRASVTAVAAQVKALSPQSFSEALAPLLIPHLTNVTEDELKAALQSVYEDAFGGQHAG